MLRAFVTSWTTAQIDGATHVVNPILTHTDENPIPGITVAMHYGDADQDGLPDKAMVLVFVHCQPAQSSDVENLKKLAGVKMMPKGSLALSRDGMPAAAINGLRGMLRPYGLETLADGFVDYRAFLNRLLQHLSPASDGLNENVPNEEFD